MSSDTVYTLLVGPRACGKSTIGTILHTLLNANGVVFVDTSSILDWAREQDDDIGHELCRLRDDQSKGIILPARLVFSAIRSWETAISSKRHLTHLILGGSPRDQEQCILWRNCHGNKVRVVHIKSDFNGVSDGVRSRQKELGVIREDEKPDSLENAYREYLTKVVPGLNVLNGQVLHIERRLPLLKQVEEVIEHIIAPDGVKARLKRRLSSKVHPARILIDQIMEKAMTANGMAIAA